VIIRQTTSLQVGIGDFWRDSTGRIRTKRPQLGMEIEDEQATDDLYDLLAQDEHSNGGLAEAAGHDLLVPLDVWPVNKLVVLWSRKQAGDITRSDGKEADRLRPEDVAAIIWEHQLVAGATGEHCCVYNSDVLPAVVPNFFQELAGVVPLPQPDYLSSCAPLAAVCTPCESEMECCILSN
jgi:hypothetical protein